MASAHIEVTGQGNRHNADLRNFIDRLQQLVNDSRDMAEGYAQASAGGDYAALAVMLALPQVNGAEDAATAEAIAGLVAAVKATLTSDGWIAQMLSRMI